jgi:pyruvate,water dikinase
VSLLCEGGLPAIRDALRARPALESAVAEYIAKFGDRCMEELKLESATLHDDPLPLLRAIGQYARSARPGAAHRPDAAEQQARQQAEARVRDALAGHPLRRLAFAWVLRHARARVRARENLRFERTRVFGRARQILLELGRRFAAVDGLDEARDVFYLELDEVLGYVEGWATTTDLKGLVAVRKAEFDAYRSQPAPADRFETRGLIYKGHAYQAEEVRERVAGDSLKGQGCCPGVVRGPVRLVGDPKRASVHPGEIIVAERTDPGWVMIFPSAAGLLIERGSLLSHSAIVARELGLPTIVSLAGVTRWLSDGDWVEMDGSTGVLTKVARPASG